METPVYPFLAVLYSDQFEPVVIWDNDWKELVRCVIAQIEALPGSFTIYAHNGGRFDYMYLISQVRGKASFKGRALMQCSVGGHELRDSLHIIPESLKNAAGKTDIDYGIFKRNRRDNHRDEIIAYCISDCRYTFDTVSAFVRRFGLPLTIGQCAMKHLKQHHDFERMSPITDEYMRQYFMGGRVECLAPVGHYRGDYKLYDVHSMYPSVMAHVKHPTGNTIFVNDKIGKNTAFIHLECDNPRGALLKHSDDGTLTSECRRGEFKVSIHEYQAAMDLGLIDNVRVLSTVNFVAWSDFAKFVVPNYDERQRLKVQLERMELDTPEYKRTKQDATFIKYLLNAAYGKFAQNPRRFKEYYLTDPNEPPPEQWQFLGLWEEYERSKRANTGDTYQTLRTMRMFPEMQTSLYWIWSHPLPEFRFNNVATAASITGAARAKLLRAIHSAVDPIYCDTDSLICRQLVDVKITDSDLGTWHLEKHISETIIAGKKLYAYRVSNPGRKDHDTTVVKSKGSNGVEWSDMLAIMRGELVKKKMKAPTIRVDGSQRYIERTLRRTAA